MADDDTVSVEAHERVKQENAKLKEAQAAAEERVQLAEQGLKLMQMRDAAAEHFRSKEGVPDPYALARMAVDSAAVREAENLTDALDGWYDSNASVFTSRSTEEAEVPEEQPQPGFAPGPNPAAPGDQADLRKVTRAEVLAKHGGLMTPAAAQELKAAMADGRYEASYTPPPEFTDQ